MKKRRPFSFVLHATLSEQDSEISEGDKGEMRLKDKELDGKNCLNVKKMGYWNF